MVGPVRATQLDRLGSTNTGDTKLAQVSWYPYPLTTIALKRSRAFPAGTMVTIGRSADQEIMLDDDRVSLNHARLEIGDGKVVFEDLASSNGSLLNGTQRIERIDWRPGQRIRIATYMMELEFVTGKTSAATPLSASPSVPQALAGGEAVRTQAGPKTPRGTPPAQNTEETPRAHPASQALAYPSREIAANAGSILDKTPDSIPLAQDIQATPHALLAPQPTLPRQEIAVSADDILDKKPNSAPLASTAWGIRVVSEERSKSATGTRLKVFVSYSREDQAFAQELIAGLKLAGFEANYDKDDIKAGEEWEARLLGLIEQADSVVFVVSPKSISSPRCSWEIDKTELLSKRLMPVVWRQVDEKDVPARLKRLNYIFFDKPNSFAQSLVSLKEALNTDENWIREHTRLGELARRWNEKGRIESLLLRGGEIADAKAWLRRRPREAQEPTVLHLEFVAESDKTEAARLNTEVERERQLHQAEVDKERMAREQAEHQAAASAALAAEARRRTRVSLIGFVVSLAFLVLALGGLVFAYKNYKTAVANEQKAIKEKRRAEGAIKAATDGGQKLLDQVMNSVIEQQTCKDEDWAPRILEPISAIMSSLVTFDESNPTIEIELTRHRFTRSLMLVCNAKFDEALNEAMSALANLKETREKGVAIDAKREAWMLRIGQSVGRQFESKKHWSEALKLYNPILLRARELVETASDVDDRRWELGKIHFRIGEAHSGSGDKTAGAKSYQQALDVLEPLAERYSDVPSLLTDIAVVGSRVATLLKEDGNSTEAIAQNRKTLTLFERVAGLDAQNIQYLKNISFTQREIVALLRDENKPSTRGETNELARAHVKQIQDIILLLLKSRASQPDNKRVLEELASAYEDLGNAYNNLGDHDAALAEHHRYRALIESLAKQEPGNAARQRSYMLALDSVASTLEYQNRFQDVLNFRQQALGIAERLSKEDRANSQAQRDLYWAELHMGDALVPTDRTSEAKRHFRNSFDIALKMSKDRSVSKTDATIAQGDLARSYGRLAKGGEQPRENLQIGLAITKSLMTRNDATYVRLEGLLGGMTDAAVYARQFDFAIICCDDMPPVVTRDRGMAMNKAHALMFIDRTTEAKSIYLDPKYRDSFMEGYGTWVLNVLGDFLKFRAAGLPAPSLMSEIESEFAQTAAKIPIVSRDR